MNFNLYIFGQDKAAYSQHPADYTQAMLQPLCADTHTSKGWVIRDRDLVHYVYAESLGNGCVAGICLIFNRAYSERVNKLFDLLRGVVETQLLDKGRMLRRNDKGDVEFAHHTLSGDTKTYEYVKSYINDSLDTELNTYGITSLTAPFQHTTHTREVAGNASNAKILELQRECNRVAIDFQRGIADNPTQRIITKLQNEIAAQTQELHDCRMEISRLNKEKKQFRNVAILAAAVVACAICLGFLNSNLRDTERKLEDTATELNDVKKVNENLHTMIADKDRSIADKDTRISSLERNVRTLTSEKDSLRGKLNIIDMHAPIIVTGVDCSLKTRNYTVHYYSARSRNRVFRLIVCKNGVRYKSFTFERDIEEGENSFSYHFKGDYEQRFDWYKFELWCDGNKLYTSDTIHD